MARSVASASKKRSMFYLERTRKRHRQSDPCWNCLIIIIMIIIVIIIMIILVIVKYLLSANL